MTKKMVKKQKNTKLFKARFASGRERLGTSIGVQFPVFLLSDDTRQGGEIQ